MFTGDIAKFNPADLLMFLGHLDKDGVLTVTKGDAGLHVSFAKGAVVDAHCAPVDGRTLRALRFHRLIDQALFHHINGLRTETGLPLRQVLESIDALPMHSFAEHLTAGMKEVVFQLFLWDEGQFHFTEMPVETDDLVPGLGCERLTLDVVWRIDEYREILRSIESVDRAPMLVADDSATRDATPLQRYVLDQSNGQNSVRDIIDDAPFSTFESVRAIQSALAQGWIELVESGKPSTAAPAGKSLDAAFSAYRRSLGRILGTSEFRRKTTEIVEFCKTQFDYSLVIAAKSGTVLRCMVHLRGKNGRLERSDIRGSNARIGTDPIFRWVHQSKHPFIGRVFESKLLAAIGQPIRDPNAECAIVPLGSIDGIDVIVYVAADRSDSEPGPFHYLELLSWNLNPPTTESAANAGSRPNEAPRAVHAQPSSNGSDGREKPMTRLVESVKELPALPSIVARILNLLSNSQTGVNELVEVLSRDPAMVARLIKVSNSALYSGGQRITTLSRTVARLGTRTVKNLVLAASTRSLFPMDRSTIGIWGQSLWQHSVECGLAASKVAELVGYADPEEAFVGGVLHDIGKVVILLNLPDEFRAIRKAQVSGNVGSTSAENTVLGFDHTMVGERLLEQWKMPQNLKACVRHHHRPDDAGDFATLSHIVALGNYLSHAYGAHADRTRADTESDLAGAQTTLEITDEQLHSLETRIGDHFEHSNFLD